MNPKIKLFFDLLKLTDLLTVDEGPYLHTWETETVSDKTIEDNEVVRFSWESEGNDYSCILTEGGIVSGTYFPDDGKFVCDDHVGERTVIRFLKTSIVSLNDPVKKNEPIQVCHWDNYEQQDAVATHLFAIDDQRVSNGQAYIGLYDINNDLDKKLDITVEVNINPLNDSEDVPCAHIHFDNDELAVSLFKVGNKILVRPETDVWIEVFRDQVRGVPETLYWINAEGRS